MKKIICLIAALFCFWVEGWSQAVRSFQKEKERAVFKMADGELQLYPLSSNTIRVKFVKQPSGMSLPEWVYINNETEKSFTVKEGKEAVSIKLPGMTAQEAADYTTVRDMIRRERQIELAWEGHRYFDVRRWEIAVTEENEPIYGVDVNQTAANKDTFFQKVVVREAEYTYKSFVKRQNFWPIPNDEIIRNPNLIQSPGW